MFRFNNLFLFISLGLFSCFAMADMSLRFYVEIPEGYSGYMSPTEEINQPDMTLAEVITEANKKLGRKVTLYCFLPVTSSRDDLEWQPCTGTVITAAIYSNNGKTPICAVGENLSIYQSCDTVTKTVFQSAWYLRNL